MPEPKWAWDYDEEEEEEPGRIAQWRASQRALATAGVNTTPPVVGQEPPLPQGPRANVPPGLARRLKQAQDDVQAKKAALDQVLGKPDSDRSKRYDVVDAEKALRVAQKEENDAEEAVRKATEPKAEPIPPRPGGAVPKGYERVYDKEQKVWIDRSLENAGDLTVGGRILRRNEEGGYDVAYEPPPSVGAGRDNTVGLANTALARERFEYQQEKDRQAQLVAEDKAQAAAEAQQAQLRAMAERNAEDNARMLEEQRIQQAEANRRAQMQSEISLANNAQSAWQAAFPYMQIPGQTHYLGFEPGGAWSQVAGMNRLPFDADRFKVAQTQYDPQSFLDWARRQQLMGGQ